MSRCQVNNSYLQRRKIKISPKAKREASFDATIQTGFFFFENENENRLPRHWIEQKSHTHTQSSLDKEFARSYNIHGAYLSANIRYFICFFFFCSPLQNSHRCRYSQQTIANFFNWIRHLEMSQLHSQRSIVIRFTFCAWLRSSCKVSSHAVIYFSSQNATTMLNGCWFERPNTGILSQTVPYIINFETWRQFSFFATFDAIHR